MIHLENIRRKLGNRSAAGMTGEKSEDCGNHCRNMGDEMDGGSQLLTASPQEFLAPANAVLCSSSLSPPELRPDTAHCRKGRAGEVLRASSLPNAPSSVCREVRGGRWPVLITHRLWQTNLRQLGYISVKNRHKALRAYVRGAIATMIDRRSRSMIDGIGLSLLRVRHRRLLAAPLCRTISC